MLDPAFWTPTKRNAREYTRSIVPAQPGGFHACDSSLENVHSGRRWFGENPASGGVLLATKMQATVDDVLRLVAVVGCGETG